MSTFSSNSDFASSLAKMFNQLHKNDCSEYVQDNLPSIIQFCPEVCCYLSADLAEQDFIKPLIVKALMDNPNIREKFEQEHFSDYDYLDGAELQEVQDFLREEFGTEIFGRPIEEMSAGQVLGAINKAMQDIKDYDRENMESVYRTLKQAGAYVSEKLEAANEKFNDVFDLEKDAV